MGLGEYRILFEQEIPLFPEIQAAFLTQTGLVIEFTATISITKLCSNYAEVLSLLWQDAEAVASIEKEKQLFYEANPQRYERWAEVRDSTKLALKQFNSISSIQLVIPGFYEVEFSIEGKLLTLSWYADHYYGMVSLINVLQDLGGQPFTVDGESAKKYPNSWKKLRHWQDYKWYNRPRK